MKSLAIFFNLLLFGIVIFLLIKHGLPDVNHDGWDDFLMVIIVGVTPIFNLIAIIWNKRNKEKSWLSLYLRRKALEEKQKIDQLN